MAKNFAFILMFFLFSWVSPTFAKENLYDICQDKYSNGQFSTADMYGCLDEAEKKAESFKVVALTDLVKNNIYFGSHRNNFLRIDEEWEEYRNDICGLENEGDPGNGTGITEAICRIAFDEDRIEEYKSIQIMFFKSLYSKKIVCDAFSISDKKRIFVLKSIKMTK